MKLDRLHMVLLGVIVILVVWITFGAWEYHRVNENILIRVNRITGTTERFGLSGWREVVPAATNAPKTFRELGPNEEILPLKSPKPPHD